MARISCDDCTRHLNDSLDPALSEPIEMNDECRLKSIYGCNIILRVCNETHHESLLAPGQCQRASQTPSTSPRHYRCPDHDPDPEAERCTRLDPLTPIWTPS